MLSIQQMRYVLEVEKTGSISQAAENLFMGQPNLSKAIKELETSLGIRIFKRTSKGVSVTMTGERFLNDIKKIIVLVESVESSYGSNCTEKQSLFISVPHCWYFTSALSAFVGSLNPETEMELVFNETDTQRAIDLVVEESHHIGIIRYHTDCEKHFLQRLSDQDIHHKKIWEFESRVTLSQKHPLAIKEHITTEELEQFIEISHGGCAILNQSHHVPCQANIPSPKRKIYIDERGSQLELLRGNPNTYLWAAAIPDDILTQNNLVQKLCKNVNNRCKDVLIFPNGYTLNELENRYLRFVHTEIQKAPVLTKHNKRILH